MSGTFTSLNTALSALNYNRVAMDVAGSNVANVGTDGYTRRRIDAESVGSPTQPALWSRYDGYGDGVKVAGVGRMVDPMLDVRARREHGSQAYLDIRQQVLGRVEAGLGEPGDKGISAALDDFRTAWQDLANNPDNGAVRQAVLGKAAALADAFAAQLHNVDSELSDLNAKVGVDLSELNTLTRDLATVNRAIATANMNGTDHSVLLDQRDSMAMRISELTGAVASQRADGGFDITLGGESLVSGINSYEVTVDAALNFAVDGNPVVLAGGEMGGLAELATTTLPAFRDSILAVAQDLANQVNAQHALGFDATGNSGGDFFTFDAAAPGGPLLVAITDPNTLAASGIAGGPNLDGGNADSMSDAINAGAGWQQLINTFGIQVSSANRLAATQQVLTDQVDGAREQISGINLDEEMVSLVQAQRSYEAAARFMTTLDSMLDTLINRTGIVG